MQDSNGYEILVDLTYSNVKEQINSKLSEVRIVTDIRGDECDDSGYCFYTGISKDGELILGSYCVTYNIEFNDEFLDSENLLEEDLNIEYKVFESYQEIKDWMLFFNNEIDKLKDSVDGDTDMIYLWDMSADDFYGDEFLFWCLRNLGSAYYEDEAENNENLMNLAKEL